MDRISLFKVLMASDVMEKLAPVLQSGFIGQGPKVEEFEAALSVVLGAPDLLTVNSCTSALDLALHLIGVGPGDEVVTTAQTCTATNGVIVNRGAVPVWADIGMDGNISPLSVGECISSKTKAIVAVDWGGRPCDYRDLKAYRIPVIEDAAHAFGATYDGRPIAQTGGDYVCWSFQAIKHLTSGDGGLLKVPPEQVERARLLRWFGLDRRSSSSFRCAQNIQEVGFKVHMNDINATIGLANLNQALEAVGRHRANALWYDECLVKKMPPNVDVLLPRRCEHVDFLTSAWWLYTLWVSDRLGFMAHMDSRGIDTSEVHRRNDQHDLARWPRDVLAWRGSHPCRVVAHRGGQRPRRRRRKRVGLMSLARHPKSGLHYRHVIPDVWGAWVDLWEGYTEFASRHPWASCVGPATFERDQAQHIYQDPDILWILWGMREPGPRDKRKGLVASVYVEPIGAADAMLPSHVLEWNSLVDQRQRLDAVFANSPHMSHLCAKQLPSFVLPIGWNPAVTGCPRWGAAKHDDYIYYGLSCGRRVTVVPRVLDEMAYHVKDVSGAFGRGLLGRLDNAKASLYIAHSNAIYSAWRIWQTIATSAALVAECGCDPWPMVDGEHYIPFDRIDDDNVQRVMEDLVDIVKHVNLLQVARRAHDDLGPEFTLERVTEKYLVPASMTMMHTRANR